MCRRKKSTKRKQRGGFTVGPVTVEDPVESNLKDIQPVPADQETVVVQAGVQVVVAKAKPDDAMVIPTNGKAGLKRVFLGVGWAAKKGERVDVDCCCAPYSKTKRNNEDTVWFGNLTSRPANDGYVTIKHSGDILTGQAEGSGELEDLERIYVDVENLAEEYDCLAFEGNIFTPGLNFSSLESAYVRLVNADTNQELLRCALDKSSDEDYLSSRVLLLAKLIRGADRWILQTTVEARDQTLRELSLHQADMAAPAAKEPVAPNSAEPMDRAGTVKNTVTQEADVAAPVQRSASPPKPKRSYLVPALAVATAGGIAAAVAIFATSDNLKLDQMTPSFFEDGVDFGNLELPWSPTDCGCFGEIDCCCINVGDTCGGAWDFFSEGLCDSIGVENPCVCCCDGLSDLGGGCGPLCDSLGDACSPLLDGCGSCFGGVVDACGNCNFDSIGDVFSGCGEGCGDMFNGCTEGCANISDGCGNMFNGCNCDTCDCDNCCEILIGD